MIRGIRLFWIGSTLLAASGGGAEAQFYYPNGYGTTGYGFGGWGASPEGSYLRGLGAYAEGEGVYNYDAAVANSVDANTAVRLNQYIWNSELDARRRYAARQAARLNMTNDQYKAQQNRIRDNPSPSDIDSGAALNVVLHQLTEPKVMSGSNLRMADAKVMAAAIREIPFRDETDAITISLGQLTDPESWPLPLRSDAFTPEREAYQKAINDALEEDKDDGTLKPATVAKVRDSVASLARKVEATIPKAQQPDHLRAVNYVKGLAGLSRMLERPNVEAVISQLEKVENTTVGNLVAFMHTYNLRFGPATTPKQSAIYRDLYPTMIAQRDKIVGKPTDGDGEPTPPPAVENPAALFHGLDSNHLYPKPRPSAGTAPADPATPVKP